MGEPFEAGKTYHHYYTDKQKVAIRDFFQEVSSAETWEQLKEYFLAEDYVPVPYVPTAVVKPTSPLDPPPHDAMAK
jgi:hypothetical protein